MVNLSFTHLFSLIFTDYFSGPDKAIGPVCLVLN